MSSEPPHEDDYVGANRAHWEAVTAIHLSAREPAALLAQGAMTLQPIDLEELGPWVVGKDLLHLQCHTGEDTLSWGRAGARSVVGVDFSPTAIATARDLAQRLGEPATFVECDVRAAAATLGRTFDVVFSSWGALCWLPDIDDWARNAASLVAPGGVLYVAEFHPFLWALADEATPMNVAVGFPYLRHAEPTTFESGTDYVDPPKKTPRHHIWNHGLGSIVTALVREGLSLVFLHEHPFAPTAIVPMLKDRGDGQYEIPGTRAYPLSYSFLARRMSSVSS